MIDGMPEVINANQVRRGGIYWVGSDGIAHPHVIVHESTDNCFLTCVISTNLKRANLPGNVLLEPGEANLPKPSIVLVSRTELIRIGQIGQYIGTLTPERMQQVDSGMAFIARISRKATK